MKNINTLIDHTLLKADASTNEVEQLIKEAQEFKFHSVCLRPEWIKDASAKYRCSAVISFPDEYIYCNSERDLLKAKEVLGEEDFDIRMLELSKALEDGALEIDPVMPIKLLNTEDVREQDKFKEILEEIIEKTREFEIKNQKNLVEKNKSHDLFDDYSLYLKPIFSCECLSDEEIELSASIFVETVLEFFDKHPDSKIKFAYKNSTGFIKGLDEIKSEIGEHGSHCNHHHAHPKSCLATPELIQQIKKQLDIFDPEKIISIKAAGGIRDKEIAKKIIQSGGDRLSHLGTSSSLIIMDS